MTIEQALIPYFEEPIIILCQSYWQDNCVYMPIFMGNSLEIPQKFYNLELISDTLVCEAKRMELVEDAIEFCLGDYRIYYIKNPKNY